MFNNIIDGTCRKSLAIIGCGPRGISVLERLAVLLSSTEGNNYNSKCSADFVIYVIDAYEIGAGRIWRENQSHCLLMNTPARETTMFSGTPDGGDSRPGAGPSLAEWWIENDPLNAAPDYFAPRAVYGKYLHFVFEKIVECLSKYATINLIEDIALDLQQSTYNTWEVFLQKNKNLIANRVVLTTGHTLTELDKTHAEFQLFSKLHTKAHYIRGDSVADMPLDNIAPNSNVGIIGSGLAFYDIMASLTEGRGGHFTLKDDGQYSYVTNGLEPKIYAGSRSGIPFPARGINEKSSDYSYKPSLFTAKRLEGLRKIRKQGKLDFNLDVLPWVEAEILLVQATCIIRNKFGGELASQFIKIVLDDFKEIINVELSQKIICHIAKDFGVLNLMPVNLYKWSRPFHEQKFKNPKEYLNSIKEWVMQDIISSMQGNLNGPFKAATDILRDIRPILKLAVDFGGLTPQSHRDDFLGSFVSIYAMLNAGPPLDRLKQVLALMEIGLLTFVGPNSKFSMSEANNGFLISSPDVDGAEYLVETLIDSRVPRTNVMIDTSPLIKQLLKRGTLTSYINSLDDISFNTGGVAVTTAPFHPISISGSEKSLYVLGVPTENTRWLMLTGTSRPKAWGQFTQDANAIAEDIMSALVLVNFNEDNNNFLIEEYNNVRIKRAV